MTAQESKLELWKRRYAEAATWRNSIVTDSRIKIRWEQYNGNGIRYKSDDTAFKKQADIVRKIVFEMVETQVDSTYPYPKVIAQDRAHQRAARIVELKLKEEMERIVTEALNDWGEREVRVQGTVVYSADWNNLESTHSTNGELVLRGYDIADVYFQPGSTSIKDCKYIITLDTILISEAKTLYGVDLKPTPGLVDRVKIKVAWYLSDRGYLSKFCWTDNDEIVFDEEEYELRKVRTCVACGTTVPQDDTCPQCGGNKFKYKELEKEILTDDLIDPETQEIIPKGTAIDWYYMRELPFVVWENISCNNSIYGISDVDIIAPMQDSISTIDTKKYKNVMKAGSIVTKPAGVNIPNSDEPLKPVTIDDPALKESFGVFNIQASTQQESLLSTELYDVAKTELGITDSYQGKRDPTAESGKAKEVAAAQSANRLESKRRMKGAAWGELYRLCFKQLLSNCDEMRTVPVTNIDGTISDEHFSRYLFLDKDKYGKLFYNDRFIFGIDNASLLTNNRQQMWQENLSNLQNGAYGDPTDPYTLRLYWAQMRDLGYPFSDNVLNMLNMRIQALQQAQQQQQQQAQAQQPAAKK